MKKFRYKLLLNDCEEKVITGFGFLKVTCYSGAISTAGKLLLTGRRGML